MMTMPNTAEDLVLAAAQDPTTPVPQLEELAASSRDHLRRVALATLEQVAAGDDTSEEDLRRLADSPVGYVRIAARATLATRG